MLERSWADGLQFQGWNCFHHMPACPSEYLPNAVRHLFPVSCFSAFATCSRRLVIHQIPLRSTPPRVTTFGTVEGTDFDAR
jgi:hypothetical protein